MARGTTGVSLRTQANEQYLPQPQATPARARESDVIDIVREIFFKLQTPELGRNYVIKAIQEGPSRQVRGHRGNVISSLNSNKRAGRVYLESRTGEFARFVLLEADRNVLAIYPQAPELHFAVYDEQGKVKTKVAHTPDLLVIEKEKLVLEEVKDEAALVKLSLRNPYQFYMDDEGVWHNRAAERHCEQLGITYRVINNRSIPATLVVNTRFLERYLRDDTPDVPKGEGERILNLFAKEKYICIAELIDTHSVQPEHLYTLVANELIYADLLNDRLDNYEHTYLFASETWCREHKCRHQATRLRILPLPGQTQLKIGSQFQIRDTVFTVRLCGEVDVEVIDTSGQITIFSLEVLREYSRCGIVVGDPFGQLKQYQNLSDYSEEDVRFALDRLEAIENNNPDGLSPSTLTRARRKLKGLVTRHAMLVSLLPKRYLGGNRKPRLSPTTEELAALAIKARFNSSASPSMWNCYQIYKQMCDERQATTCEIVLPMSYDTFTKRCKTLISNHSRYGSRKAYQKQEIIQRLKNGEYPIHGVCPHDICHIDHTVADMESKSPSGINLGRYVFSIAVDGCTTQPRAFFTSYWPPSIASVFMVLRDYIRRWGRLPLFLCLDNGPEMHCNELDKFAEYFGVNIVYRPKAKPRNGAIVERMFHSVNSAVLHNLDGNTKHMKNPREVSPTHSPTANAKWSLLAAYNATEKYLFDTLPNTVHPQLGMTPNDFEKQQYKYLGNPQINIMTLNQDAMLFTAPRTIHQVHTLSRRKGIWHNGQWFRHPLLRELPDGAKLAVRVEPWEGRVIYVYIGGNRGWVCAVGVSSRHFPECGLYEMRAALSEQRRTANKRSKDSKNRPDIAKTQVRLLSPANFDSRLREQHEEMVVIYKRLGLTKALEEDISSTVQYIETNWRDDTAPPRSGEPESTYAEYVDSIAEEHEFTPLQVSKVSRHPAGASAEKVHTESKEAPMRSPDTDGDENSSLFSAADLISHIPEFGGMGT